jgi:hypothetical protein
MFTELGAVLDRELARDHELIDRQIVRASLKYRPNWTGVQYRVNFRVTFFVEGHLFAYEEPMGLLFDAQTPDERKEVETRVKTLKEHVEGLCKKYGLELRSGATHGG